VVAFDHPQDRAWIISQGFPESGSQARALRAVQRIEEVEGWLGGESATDTTTALRSADVKSAVLGCSLPSPSKGEELFELAVVALAPQFAVPGHEGLTSNFGREEYLKAVERVIQYIRAGDVFQVNLAQRLLYPARDDSIALYLRLRRRNPATFAGYFDTGTFQIASASPERFLQARGRDVETRPIKGTRPWTGDAQVDQRAAEELLASEKDRAENVMIVDLMRNDLSRVCRPESVQVTQLCQVEVAQYVQHLVSAVRGTLRDDCGPIDLLQAAFPGGSVTGAPKVRAMEIIAELEPTTRGPYCGALGYLGFDGTMDTSILIRTITAGRGWWQFPVGGGIVAASDPQREYEETWHKAEGLIRALA
jgi:para-aminobenzoate synthetase component I